MKYLPTPKEIEHYTKCAISAEKFDYAFAQFVEEYPNYCRTCGGGRWSTTGQTYWEPPELVPCPTCTDQYICGICGEELLEETEWETCKRGCDLDIYAPFFECYCDMERDYHDSQEYYKTHN